MSADNWTKCPRCVENYEGMKARMFNEVAEAYGQVTSDEYRRMQQAYELFVREGIEDTLREDYEIGIEDGKFVVGYLASCDCGFQFRFDHSVDVFQ